jgi:hypothetical protein
MTVMPARGVFARAVFGDVLAMIYQSPKYIPLTPEGLSSSCNVMNKKR